jgi:hypothetical protein
MDHAAVAADHVRDQYPELLASMAATADAVSTRASTGGGPEGVAAGRVLRAAYRDALADAGLLGRLPGVLASTVHALGESLPDRVVPAPPYVTVTSLGVVLRATIDAGRLVVELHLFEPQDGGYRALADGHVSARLRRTTGPAVRTADRT